MKKGITWFLGLSLIFLWSFTSKVSNDLSDIQDPTIDDIVKSYKKAIVDYLVTKGIDCCIMDIDLQKTISMQRKKDECLFCITVLKRYKY